MRKTKRPQDIKDILKKVIGKIEKQGPDRKEKILNAWQRIAGDKAASHSRPVRITRKKMVIEVDSSTWFYSLTLQKNRLLREIIQELGEDQVKDIRFRMGEIQ